MPDEEIASWGNFRADDLPVSDIADHADTAQRIINKTGW
jgi:hypothetical protein